MSKRVLVLYVGGLYFPTGFSAVYVEELLRGYLELQLMSNATVKIIADTPGTNMTWDNVVTIGQAIQKNYADFDGFVVVHGVDNAIYSSTFLRFLYKNIGKPIVFTGNSQPGYEHHFSEEGTYDKLDIRTNLITAVQLATLDCAEIFLAYGTRIIRAVRAIERYQGTTHIFSSWHEEDIATLQFDVQLTAKAAHRNNLPVVFDSRYNANIVAIPMAPNSIMPPLDTAAAIIACGYQEQLLTSTINFPTDIPIIVSTAVPPLMPPADNVLVVTNATYQTLYAKTLVTLGQTTSLAEFREAFYINQHGEFY